VSDKLGVDGSAVRPGPVLLVDDIVDSGWTLTVAGSLLRTHGSGEVHPFALAAATARDG
jgi:ATP-dependent DNA helicase RecQ